MQLRLIFYLRPRLAPRREGFYPGKERDRRSLERATTLGPTGVAGELPRGEKEESEEAFGERRGEGGARGGGVWVKQSGTVTEAESGRIQRLFLFSGNLLPARIRADARFLIVRATPRTLSSFSLIPRSPCPMLSAGVPAHLVCRLFLSSARIGQRGQQRGGIVPPRLR